eukprot:sb/3467023/
MRTLLKFIIGACVFCCVQFAVLLYLSSSLQLDGSTNSNEGVRKRSPKLIQETFDNQPIWKTRLPDSPDVEVPLRGLSQVQMKLFKEGMGLQSGLWLDKSGVFKCDEGKVVLDLASVNDDYCDCEDHTDEPATAACYNLINQNNEALKKFKQTTPAEIGNMTVRDFIEAGYLLDYNLSDQGKFLALSHLHVDFKASDIEAHPATKGRPTGTAPRSVLKPTTKPAVRESVRRNLVDLPEFSTPAPGTLTNAQKLLITPRVVLPAKKGHIVVYTENGSPYHLNVRTMKAVSGKQQETAVEPESEQRPRRTTRATKR